MSEPRGFDPPSGPPAGWYPDPYDPSGQRYWNGREWDLTTPAGASDDGDYAELGTWLDRSFRTGLRRWRAVAVQAVLTSVVSAVLVAIATDRILGGLTVDGDRVEGWTNDRLAVALPLLALAILTGAVGGLATIWLVLREVDTRSGDLTWGSELRSGVAAVGAGLRLLPRAVVWFGLALLALMALGLVLAVLGVVLGPAVIALVLVAMPLFVWLAVKWAFVVVSIVDRPGNPYPRSSRVSDGRWWRTLGRFLLISIILWLVSAVMQAIIGLATGAGLGGIGSGLEVTVNDAGELDRIVLDDQIDLDALTIVGTALASLVGTVLTSSVMAAALSLLYRTRNARH